MSSFGRSHRRPRRQSIRSSCWSCCSGKRRWPKECSRGEEKMPIETPIAWICLGAGAELALYLLLKGSTLVQERTLDDVFPFLQFLEKDEMAELFNTIEETFRRLLTSDYPFLREQHVRLVLSREL